MFILKCEFFTTLSYFMQQNLVNGVCYGSRTHWPKTGDIIFLLKLHYCPL